MANNDIWSEHPFYKHDPFPQIKPALLNSADIKCYMDKGCLIEEGSFELKRLKTASYEMRFLGELYDWHEVDGKLQRCNRKIHDGQYIKLDKNSISYLWMEEWLLLPEYIAARFNLHIRHVHKGILLGTGPLIDPGFGGRILIPLHNLTDNDYVLKGGEGIIWVEFTKVSKNDYWLSNGDNADRPVDLVTFPSLKVIDNPTHYLDKAGVLDKGGVQSAFKGVLERTRSDAESAKSASEDARDKVKSLDRRIRNFTLAGAIGGFVGIGALLLSAYQISIPVMKTVHDQSDRIDELEVMLKDMEDPVESQSSALRVPVDEPLIETEETALVEAQPVDVSDKSLEPEIPTPLPR